MSIRYRYRPPYLAVAALVALVVVRRLFLIWAFAVNRLRLAFVSGYGVSCSIVIAALPPSKTTSGLSGQWDCQVREVVLNGLRPPAGAMGW